MKLSACMIAKNEEEMLPRCLKSIHKLCDEIIFIDTGSTDKTVEIAESFGAEVIKCKWKYDFSLHRNQAFDYATGDWFFVIDCDEELINTDIDPVLFKERLLMVEPNIGALAVGVEEEENGITTTWAGKRFFKASANPKYEGCVHNKATHAGFCGGTDLKIRHYGYHLSPEKMKKKRERTLSLLQKRLEQNPDDASAHYYMCQIESGNKNHDEVIRYGTRCFDLLDLKPDELQFFGTIYPWVSQAYFIKAINETDVLARQGYLDECYSWLLKGLELNPEDIDLNFLMAQLFFNCNEYEKMRPFCDQYIKTLEKVNSDNQHKSDTFVNKLSMKDFVTRTTYFSGELHEKVIRRWITHDRN